MANLKSVTGNVLKKKEKRREPSHVEPTPSETLARGIAPHAARSAAATPPAATAASPAARQPSSREPKTQDPRLLAPPHVICAHHSSRSRGRRRGGEEVIRGRRPPPCVLCSYASFAARVDAKEVEGAGIQVHRRPPTWDPCPPPTPCVLRGCPSSRSRRHRRGEEMEIRDRVPDLVVMEQGVDELGHCATRRERMG